MLLRGHVTVSRFFVSCRDKSFLLRRIGARARVRSWNVNTKILELGNISGDFTPGEIITGQKSNATFSLKIVNTDNLRDANDDLNIADKYAQNKQIQIEGDEIIDFSDENPFGMP